MKKRLFALTLLLALLAGCGLKMPQPGSENDDYEADVYFLGPVEQGRTGRPMVVEHRQIKDQNGPAAWEALVRCMYYPQEVGNRPLIPPQVRLKSVTQFGTVAVVDFSREYQALRPLDQSLLAGGVAMTLLGQEDVEYVRITSEGTFQPPMGTRYYSLDRIMLTSDAIAFNAFDVALYFISGDEESLTAAQRTIKSAGGFPSPYAQLMELLNPPEEEGLWAPLQRQESVNFCQMEGEICHIDLSEIKRGRVGQLQVYAMVNTVTSNSAVRGVVVTLRGKPLSSAGIEGCDGELTFSKAYVD